MARFGLGPTNVLALLMILTGESLTQDILSKNLKALTPIVRTTYLVMNESLLSKAFLQIWMPLTNELPAAL